ncbi:hypothetical protein WOLCODRAFT_25874 [Wolfiporia cocos MD-104 SS10]|uniref:VanZ-like domain-containing protein n=1 Tax=Wolfiporia cocos (strain MD-104) TaxID=742152 RepID=A0A2H3JMF2_WOLCO|nr:hypothetical protein WOLCODRAFT_25874 [Wolfiporia cocos MD-104 SS10]
MVGLGTSSSETLWTKATRTLRKYIRRSNKAIMRSHRMRIPRYDMPLRFRPYFLVFTLVIMVMLGLLGFTNFSHALPLNDKLLHFVCLCVATGVFYFIFDVEEDARRIWFWRSSPLILTGVTCFFFGGIMSEFVQAMLPYKEFQIGDVAANLLGSSLGLYVAYHLERYYRHRREISRLYRPLDSGEGISEGEDDFEEGSTQLLPSHYQPSAARSSAKPGKPNAGAIRLEDVWDEGEELFDLGDDSEDEGSGHTRAARASDTPAPKIVVTSTES